MTDKSRINIWVSPEQKTKWDNDAQALGITLTDYIKRAVHALTKTVVAVDNSAILAKLASIEAKLEIKMEQKTAIDAINLLLKDQDTDTVLGFLKHGAFDLGSMNQQTTIGITRLSEAIKKLAAAGKIIKTGENKWTLK